MNQPFKKTNLANSNRTGLPPRTQGKRNIKVIPERPMAESNRLPWHFNFSFIACLYIDAMLNQLSLSVGVCGGIKSTRTIGQPGGPTTFHIPHLIHARGAELDDWCYDVCLPEESRPWEKGVDPAGTSLKIGKVKTETEQDIHVVSSIV